MVCRNGECDFVDDAQVELSTLSRSLSISIHRNDARKLANPELAKNPLLAARFTMRKPYPPDPHRKESKRGTGFNSRTSPADVLRNPFRIDRWVRYDLSGRRHQRMTMPIRITAESVGIPP